MAFDLLDYPIVTRTPRMVSITSAWLGHIPFAMALVQMLRPRTIVELGTHQGDSYCAFCEAVLALGLPTRCTAVDTWTGDAHAGAYTEDVLTTLRRVHDPAYGAFSTLMRTTFADAAGQVPDGSVDLLHIDGLHTYAAVRADYEQWLPKMSGRGVILFHDTAERDRDFGVWRLWDEVTAGRPHFNFTHSHGLGLLVVGAAPPPPLLEFLGAATRRPDVVRGLFAQLAAHIEAARALREVTLPLANTQANLNKWFQQTGRQVQPREADPNASALDPPGFTYRLDEQVRIVLNEDLRLRQAFAASRANAGATPAAANPVPQP